MRGPAATTAMFLWHGRALIVGPGLDSTPHAHYAAQLSLALDRPVRLRLPGAEHWVQTEAALFAPNAAHQLDCGGAQMAHLFVELPARSDAVATDFCAGFHRRPEFAPVRAALEQARRGTLDVEDAGRAVQQWLDCALPSGAGALAHDARIQRALDWMAAHPGERLNGAFLAALAHLSESRFTHLFRQQTGMSLSRYLLWTRLLQAVEAVANGQSMTAAAHEAGFSDLAHLSRTFRATFGVVPSELHKMTIAFKQTA